MFLIHMSKNTRADTQESKTSPAMGTPTSFSRGIRILSLATQSPGSVLWEKEWGGEDKAL